MLEEISMVPSTHTQSLQNNGSVSCFMTLKPLTKSIMAALTFTTLWDYSADDKLIIFFLFFPENTLSHFMKCQNLFSRKKKK